MNPNVILGIYGVSALQLAALYEHTAPSLQDMRHMEPGDEVGRQTLLDANLIVGSFAILLSLIAYYATHSALPAVFFIGTVAIAASWRYMVLYSERF
jgi:hypothetical protein